jgi:Tn3 transposase DDE domain
MHCEANEGKIRRRRYEEQLNQASCLNLVTNAVVLWNTVYIKAVLDQLQAEGQHVDDVGVAHLSPTRYAHLNPYGKYRFNVDEEFHQRTSPAEIARFRIGLTLFFVHLLSEPHIGPSERDAVEFLLAFILPHSGFDAAKAEGLHR